MHCEPRPERKFNPSSIFAFMCGVTALIAVAGCGNRGAGTKQTTTEKKEDQLAAALQRLDKDADLSTCREVLQILDSGITVSVPRPEPSTNDLQPIGELLQLTSAEIEALASKEFTALDPDYLAECLLIRDARLSLEMEGFTKKKQAALAFDWVCRMVYLAYAVPAPPWWVLQAGNGSGVDRAHIFLALLQQLEIPGSLIGAPEIAKFPCYLPPRERGGRPGYVPARAVGALIEGEVLLFDPWLGKAITTTDGKIATLAALRNNPEMASEWLRGSGVSSDDVKNWQVFLTTPLSSMAPRMRWLQERMNDANRLVLWVDPSAMISSYRQAIPGVKCQFWNLPNDQLSFCRMMAGYDQEVRLPNGVAASPLKEEFRKSRFPDEHIPNLRVGQDFLGGKPRALLEAIFRSEFAPVFLVTGSPRDFLLRGNFTSAMASLDDLDRRNTAFRSLSAVELRQESPVAEWADKANEIFARTISAEQSGDATELARARTAESDFLKTPLSERMALRVRDKSSLLLSAEAKYLMALLVHERAERIQARLEQAGPKELKDLKKEAARAWDNAIDNWQIYLKNFLELSRDFRDRDEHARGLLERSRQCLQDAKK